MRLERLGSITCLARRYLGPREEGARQWADFLARLPGDLAGRPRIGLAYDDPRITPPERIRYDCAVSVGEAFAVPERLVAQGFERLATPAGAWACTDVLGEGNVAAGYGAILGGWLPRNTDWTLEGDPFLEFVRSAPDPQEPAPLTVCLRVRRVAVLAAPNMAPTPLG